MKTFEIKVGKGKGALTLDAAKLVEGRCLIQGVSGSGKSYLVRVIAEQAIPAGLQTILLDPEGEFLLLREHCDVLIAGKEGDVPTETRSAKLLARRIAETGISTVVDMSDLKLDDRRMFVSVFLSTLDSLPKKLERPRLVVLDESHRFCPESGKGSATSTDAVITLMSQGRKRGLAGVLVTQRLSKLKKDAAAEAANVFIAKTSPIDLHSAQDMLGVLKEDREELRRLKPGEFYATGPALSVEDVTQFQARRSITTHPEPGSRYKMGTPPPRRAIEKILKEFAELPPEKAKEDAANLSDAQKRIRDLERQLKKSNKETSDARGQWSDADIERMVKKSVAKIEKRFKDDYGRADKIADAIFKDIMRAKDLLDSAQSRTDDLSGVLKATVQLSLTESFEDARTTAQHVNGSDRTVRPASSTPRPVSTTRSGKSRMLAVLAQHVELSRQALAHLSGMSPGSGTFNTYLSDGKKSGWWETGDGIVRITDEGLANAGDVDPLPSGERLLDYWCGQVTGAARDMLRAIAEAGGEGILRLDLARMVGMSPGSGTFNTYLSTLRKLKLISRKPPFVAVEEIQP